MKNKDSIKLKQLKKKELNILREFDKLCKKHNIKYSLAFGTLLGAIRHKGFIPWDDDIDIFMTRENYLLLKEHISELPKCLFFQDKSSDNFKFDIFMCAKIRDKRTQVEFQKNYQSGVFIDIFVIDNIWKNKVFRKIQEKYYLMLRYVQYREKDIKKNLFQVISTSLLLEKLFLKYIVPKKSEYYYLYWRKKAIVFHIKDIFPIKNILFEKKNFLVMSNPRKFLKGIYGNYLILPPKKDRICSHVDLDKIKI